MLPTAWVGDDRSKVITCEKNSANLARTDYSNGADMRITQSNDEKIFKESSKGFGEDCFSQEKINRTLMDLLMRFAEDVGEMDVAAQLDAIKNGKDEKWHERWLEEFPWVRELFFRYFLIGERAIAEAECYLLDDGSTYAQSFSTALIDCIESVQRLPGSRDVTASQAVEGILRKVSEKVNSVGYVVEKKNRDHVPLRVVQRYAVGAGREDQLQDLDHVIRAYLACCKNGVEDFAFRESVLMALTRQKSIYQEAYPRLKDLTGEYQKVADSKRIDAIPNDFERNLAMIGCADAVARFGIEKRFKEKFAAREGDEGGMVKALCGNLTARQTDSVFRKADCLPGEIASRIVSHKLLSWLFREWMRKSTYAANDSKQGAAEPVSASGCVSRTWGPIGQWRHEEREYLDWFSGTVVGKLRGWGDSRIKNTKANARKGDSGVDTDEFLREWVESRTDPQGTDRTNVSLIRFLDGGLTFKNLKEVVDNYVRNLLVKDINEPDSEFGRPLVPLNVKQGDGEESGRELIDTIEDVHRKDVDARGEVLDMQRRIYDMLGSYDQKLAVYFRLVRFGLKDFAYQNFDDKIISKEGKEILARLSEEDVVSESVALQVIGEAPTNTNWFKRSMRKFITSNPGKIKELLNDGDEASRFVSQFK